MPRIGNIRLPYNNRGRVPKRGRPARGRPVRMNRGGRVRRPRRPMRRR